ncbi:hypothetical protein [Alicyclobacillus ferrooxydans]|uniref:hypothetical protein n=1 Tax=Alicyclobacillus ferrooxydans TaxID=471514 RepID=UPI000AC2770E|nr:hypothetical protein [Alicyclobacillus ferrooxydans]
MGTNNRKGRVAALAFGATFGSIGTLPVAATVGIGAIAEVGIYNLIANLHEV